MTPRVWAWMSPRMELSFTDLWRINFVGEDQKLVLNFECFELWDIQVKCWVECLNPDVQKTGLSIWCKFGSWQHEVVFKAIRLDEIIKATCWKRSPRTEVLWHSPSWRWERIHLKGWKRSPIEARKIRRPWYPGNKGKGGSTEEETINFSGWYCQDDI